jgi:anti-anti-sigma regulatory factor
VVLDLKGKLALGDGAGLVKDKVNSLIFQGQKLVLLNLEGVPLVHSMGLGELVAASVSMVNKGGGRRASSCPAAQRSSTRTSSRPPG